MDPHGLARSSSLTRCSLRRGHDRYLIMIPQWSLPRAIQLGPHFSTLRCHHAFPSGRYILDLWAWFSYGFGWPGLHVWWEMVSCHLFFWPVTHPMPYWGILPLWMRFKNLGGVARLFSFARRTSRQWSSLSLRWFLSGASRELPG